MKRRTPQEKLAMTLKTLGYSLISLPDKSQNIALACFYGKIEHRFGRITGVMIAISFLIAYLNIQKYNLLLGFIIGSFISWVIYLTAHTLEKKFYVKNFRSSTIGNK